MEKVASQLMDKIQAFADEHPDLVKGMLAGGGVGALGGALMTGDDPAHKDESAVSRFGRRLKNALIGAGMGAAATGAIGYGLGTQIGEALPADDVAPEAKAMHSPELRALGAAGFGLGAVPFENSAKDTASKSLLNILSGRHDRFDKGEALDMLTQKFKSNPTGVVTELQNRGMSPEDIASALRRAGQNTSSLEGSLLNRLGGNTFNELTTAKAPEGAGILEKLLAAGKQGAGYAGKGLYSIPRFIGRNPRTAALAALGIATPELLDTGAKAVGDVLGEATLR